jgi:hypothetical protein
MLDGEAPTVDMTIGLEFPQRQANLANQRYNEADMRLGAPLLANYVHV